MSIAQRDGTHIGICRQVSDAWAAGAATRVELVNDGPVTIVL